MNAATYPATPGYKTEDPETSRRAAEAVAGRAEVLRDRVLGVLRKGERTADEVAAVLGESVLAVRPRLSELRKAGSIEYTGARRRNASGHSAAVARVARRYAQEELFK